jgi:two-component system NtrC family sensor kinase
MQGRVPGLIRDRRYWLLLLLVWAGVVGWSLRDHLQSIRQHNQDVVTEGARNMFRMVLLTRLWNSTHGGVYVLVNEQTQPNPYLNDPKRDITDNHGRALTLVNPAYMTRLIGELSHQDEGVAFHITSLMPINPGNAADAWERPVLTSFEHGVREFAGFEQQATDGLVHRYMAPLVVVEACLKCHAAQGYKVGDIRGGISVSQRYQPFLEAAAPSELQGKLRHGAVFLLVMAACWWLLEQLRRRWLELDVKVDEVEQAHKELVQSEKMASLGRMVAGFAHEINTPIGVAVGAITHGEETLNKIDCLLDNEEVSEDALRAELASLRQGDGLAISNLRRAAALVQSFKRTSIDQATESERSFNVRELIDDVLHALHNELKRQPVTLSIDCPDALQIHGVPGLLEQLLTNLVMNSIVHGFENGTRGGEIGIAVALHGDCLRLDYRDSGAGMAPDVAARVFEPFFTTRRNEGGSGLGLYICYTIVTTRLGGTIHCESRPGEGCRFLIDFPVKDRESV